jgi:L-threonylcarbamoyladenylate synthase
MDAGAVAKIFTAKERPEWDPLIVHIDDRAMLTTVVAEVSPDAERLMEAFWPGPLTLLLPKHPRLPEAVTAGLARVGVRMPAHPVTRALLRAAKMAVAAPSANRFGRTSPTSADHVAEDLDGRIEAILDGGVTTHGVESTVVDVSAAGCGIYRPGVITEKQIRAICRGDVWEQTGEGESAGAAPAPGMGVRHYAPRARLVLVEGPGGSQVTELAKVVGRCEAEGENVGVMLPDAFLASLEGRRVQVYEWGSWSDAEELARRLFAGLRRLDAAGVTVIVAPMPEAKGIGVAVRDRLRRAGKRQDQG